MDKNYIAIVFDGPPSHEAGRFVEVNDSHGKSLDIGTWVSRGDGLWELRIAVDKLKDDNDMTVDTRREAVEALITEAEEFTNPTVGYAFKSDYDHDRTVPLLDSLRHALAALLNQRDQRAASATQFATELSRCQHSLEVAQQRIRDLEATNRKISERSANHHDNAIKWRERAERAEAALEGSEQSRLAGEQKLASVQAERDKLTAKLEAVKAFIANRSVIGGMDRMRLAAILADTDEPRDSITFNTDDLGPATDIDGNPLADTDEGSGK